MRLPLRVTIAALLLLPALVAFRAGQAVEPRPAKMELGLNLTGVIDYSPELVFRDAFLQSRPWISQQRGKPWGQGEPLDLDANGWVKSLKPGQAAETLMFTELQGHYPAGEYTCLYEGEGEIAFSGAARVAKSEPGKMSVNVDPKLGGVFLKLTGVNAEKPIRNIQFLMPRTGESASTLFAKPILERYDGMKFFRFMDWAETNGSKISEWKDRPTPRDARQVGKGVCLEYQIAFANTMKADPWFCVPHLATDDYVREMAKLIKMELAAERKLFVEYSNETWNGQFAQARYCQEQGVKLALSANAYEAQLRYSSQRSVEIFRIFEEVFGGTDRIVRVLAAQSANPWSSMTVLAWKDAYRHADALAIAPYFGGELGDPKTAKVVEALSVDEILDRCQMSLRKNVEPVTQAAKLARKYQLELLAYEGGQHLVGHGGAENNERLMRKFHEANRHPRMKELYLEDLANWRKAGGGRFCLFSSMSRPGKWGSWGLLEYEGEPIEKAPKFAAVREFMKSLQPSN